MLAFGSAGRGGGRMVVLEREGRHMTTQGEREKHLDILREVQGCEV